MPDAGHTEEHKEQSDSVGNPQDHGVAKEVPAAAAADAHGHAAVDSHADSHGDTHEQPADVIPEGSWQDGLLVGLALAVLLSFLGLMGYWSTLPLAPVLAEQGEQHVP